ncbi:MAG: flagellar protein FlbE [Micavibrio sp.]
MNQQDTRHPRNMKKFLFDVHNFDGNKDKDDLVEVEPPPPVFSQEELAAAKKEAFAAGKKEGLTEALNSFEQQVTETLAVIRDNFSILFDAEDRRSRVFEKESVQLAYTVFIKAFPALNEKYGMEEVRSTVSNILETVREQPEIVIDVPPAYTDVIQRHIDGLLRQDNGPRCIIRGNDNLGAGQCKLAWVNGTATRNPGQLTEQMRTQIEHLLADKAVLTDNDMADPIIPSGAATDHGERDE